jgi:hypothetical protein
MRIANMAVSTLDLYSRVLRHHIFNTRWNKQDQQSGQYTTAHNET